MNRFISMMIGIGTVVTAFLCNTLLGFVHPAFFVTLGFVGGMVDALYITYSNR